MAQALRTEKSRGFNGQLLPDSPLIERRILVVEDDEQSRKQLKKLLEGEPGIKVDTAEDGVAALKILSEHPFSLVLTDLKLPHLDGMHLIEELQKRNMPASVIVMTGYGKIDEAVQAMHMGASDFLTKPLDFKHLSLVIKRALAERKMRDELAHLREQLSDRYSFQSIISKSPRMHEVFELIGNVAQTTATVMICGETGTGKEMVARAIHQSSALRGGPLIAVNCVALPEQLLESELFGHEKGAFTGAVSQRHGRFEMAHGGTIFLDEVGDVPPGMQAKLLRVLQERRFERVGGTESIDVDVRVVCATNRSLLRLVKKGQFREDLYYRLNVVKIDLPPLRERPEDVPLLATHFAEKYAQPGAPVKRIAPAAMNLLLKYHWPGNIRELENAIERACVTSQDSVIAPENLPPEIMNPSAPKSRLNIDLDRPLPEVLADINAEVEKQYIRKALNKSHGNIGRCAKICGLSRRSISAKIAAYKIDKGSFKEI
jgi:DNA-binding NtrC family response regulator